MDFMLLLLQQAGANNPEPTINLPATLGVAGILAAASPYLGRFWGAAATAIEGAAAIVGTFAKERGVKIAAAEEELKRFQQIFDEIKKRDDALTELRSQNRDAMESIIKITNVNLELSKTNVDLVQRQSSDSATILALQGRIFTLETEKAQLMIQLAEIQRPLKVAIEDLPVVELPKDVNTGGNNA